MGGGGKADDEVGNTDEVGGLGGCGIGMAGARGVVGPTDIGEESGLVVISVTCRLAGCPEASNCE
jgi:hypothetical protein